MVGIERVVKLDPELQLAWSGNFAAFDAANGKPLWHSRINNISNAPQTFLVGGRQQVLVAVGDTLYAFMLP